MENHSLVGRAKLVPRMAILRRCAGTQLARVRAKFSLIAFDCWAGLYDIDRTHIRRTSIMANDLYGISAKRIDGSNATLGDYKGSVLMIVNVASKCGLTPQYAELEKVYEKYREKGFYVL